MSLSGSYPMKALHTQEVRNIYIQRWGEEGRVRWCHVTLSRTLKVRGGIISQANRYLSDFRSSERIFPPQITQVLLLMPPAALWRPASPRCQSPL
jgi:hypothetical protein